MLLLFPTIYRAKGEGGGATLAPSSKERVRPRGGGGVHPPQGTSEVPSPFRTLPFPSSLQAHGPWWGGAPAHLGAGPFSHLAHVCLRGPVAPPGGPPDPSGGPGTLPVMPGTLPVAKTILPIYQSLPPDHSGTPRDVWDLIRDFELPSVTTYNFPLQL